MADIPTITIVESIAQPAIPDGAVPAQQAKDQDEIARLRSKGQDYKDNEVDWRFFLRSYEGGHEYVTDDTLHKHRREHVADYDNRKKRSVYVNFIQPLTDFVPEYIFSQGVERDAPTALGTEFELFKANCDRAGSTLDNFMQQVGEDARIFGMTFVQVDKMPLPAGIDPETVSVQKASELGISIPYLIPVRPLEVYDWRCDPLGNFLYLKRYETYATANATNTGYRELERYTEWSPAQMRTTVLDVTDPQSPSIDSRKVQSNRWGVVPFIPIFYKRKKSNKDVGQSFLQDLAYQNNYVFNLTSLISEFLYKQCVTASTLIDCPRDLEKYPNGIPIEDLVGTEFETYAWSIDEQRYRLRRAFDVRKTGHSAEVWRLKFEYRDEFNQVKFGHLDATPGHPILLQTDQYVALRDLKAGDKLVPFYRWVDGYPRGNRPHILQGLSPYSGIAEHRFIVGESEALVEGQHVHHKDGRPLNNEPSNLEQLPASEHRAIERRAQSERKRKWWREASEQRRRFVTAKALAGIKKWRDTNPAAVADAYQRQSVSIARTLSKKREAADCVENVNHVVVSVEFLGYEDVYNLEVEVDHNYVANGIVVHNCFNVLAMPSRAQMPLRSTVEGEMGTSNVLEVPEDSKLMPAYISPPSGPAQFIQAERAETVTQMYRTAAQDIMSELFTQQPRSADAQKQSFSRTIPVINKTADILEFGERRIMTLWARMQNETWDGKISYKDDYSITSLLDLLLQLTQIFNSIRMPSPTFAREEWKRVVREFDGKIPHDKLETIVEEIDKISDEDIKQLFATPVDLQAQMGVPATSNLLQGKKQTQLGTDKRIGAGTGSKASTKEAAPDANRRATGGRSAKKS